MGARLRNASTASGREAIKAVDENPITSRPTFTVDERLPTAYAGDLALASTSSSDNTGGRVQVVRRQPDRTWLRLIDRPETRPQP